MRVGVLFSGGKDSTYSAWLAKKEGHEISCLITVISENEESFMFHTPAIELTKKQAKLMEIPILVHQTRGIKELELKDLEKAIFKAKRKYGIEGIVTGALASVYQASRIQKICDNLNLECLNPLWKKDKVQLLGELIRNKFEIILSGVFAYPFDVKWVGRKIDKEFIEKIKILTAKYKINPAGEGGEFESLVLNCPLFKEKLKVKIVDTIGKGNSWKGIFKVQ
jgi:ABC transporter with metal-binding/Fe-S-binding domain ATP-binding protein